MFGAMPMRGPVTGLVPPGQLDNTHSPAALFLLDGDLTDSATSPTPDLAVAFGSEAYADTAAGNQVFAADGGTALAHASSVAALQATGDLTLQATVRLRSLSTRGVFFRYGGAAGDGDSTQNVIYALWAESNGTLVYFHEYGTGANQQFNTAAKTVTINRWLHLAMVRESNVIKHYVNGNLVATSGTLIAPADGSAGRLSVAGSHTGGNEEIDGLITNAKIITAALSAGSVRAESALALGMQA